MELPAEDFLYTMGSWKEGMVEKGAGRTASHHGQHREYGVQMSGSKGTQQGDGAWFAPYPGNLSSNSSTLDTLGNYAPMDTHWFGRSFVVGRHWFCLERLRTKRKLTWEDGSGVQFADDWDLKCSSFMTRRRLLYGKCLAGSRRFLFQPTTS
jgi:hypothetical protein